jgi:polar amino acid transport system substrate-binding protein
MMRKIGILALVLLVGALAASCGGSDNGTGEDAEANTQGEAEAQGEASDSSLEDVLAKGELILGCDDSFAPMGFRDQKGDIVGFDIDLARGVAEKLGVELVIKPINWQTKEMELTNGNIDVIWNGYSITAARDLEVEFTKPYLNNEQLYVVRADSDIQSVADLAEKVLGCQIDSAAQSAIEADAELSASIAELTKYDQYQDALYDLKISDRVAAVAVDKVLINYEMSMAPGVYRVLDDILSIEYYGIGCRKGEAALREAIDQALDDMQTDGTTDAICETWFGENIVIRDVEKLTQAELIEAEG